MIPKHTPLVVSCFNVDYEHIPETKKASPIDHVTIVSIGNIDGSLYAHVSFLADLCALGQKTPSFSLARINYSGLDDSAQLSGFLRTHKTKQLSQFNKDCTANTDCFLLHNREQLSQLFRVFWNCFGGNWLIAVDCRDQNEFVRCHTDVTTKMLRPSKGRDCLVECSTMAGITYDDTILDFLTRKFSAQELRNLITQLAIDHSVNIEFVQHRFSNRTS